MKKTISLLLALIMCFSVFSIMSFANEDVERTITSVELHNVRYYASVKNEEKIPDAVFYVNFVAYFDDGTSAEYDSKKGWSDATITSEVSWYVQPETDENFGDQQSLYITIDGEDFWAGYVNVEVSAWKAIFRVIVTWSWLTPDLIKKTSLFFLNIINWFATLFQ